MRKAFLAISLSFSINSVFAAGIPVVDGANIANTFLMIEEAKNQLTQLKNQVDTAKNQLSDFRNEVQETKRRLEGFNDFGSIFDSSVSYLTDTLNDYQKEISKKDIELYLKTKGIEIEQGSIIENDYRRKVEKIKRFEKMQDNLSTQSKKLDGLHGKFKQAETPQKREEILNTIQLESLKMQNTMKTVEFEMRKQEQENEIQEKEELKKHMSGQTKSPSMKGFFILK